MTDQLNASGNPNRTNEHSRTIKSSGVASKPAYSGPNKASYTISPREHLD